MTESWAVTVERDGEQVVTIASNHLSGRDLSPDDEHAIETAALHLLAFLGRSVTLPSPSRPQDEPAP